MSTSPPSGRWSPNSLKPRWVDVLGRGAGGGATGRGGEGKTLNFDTEDIQKKTSIPPCFSTVLGGKTGGTVPKKGEHSVPSHQ